MSKFNNSNASVRKGNGFLETTEVIEYNHKGALGFGKVAKSELFLAAVSDFGNEASFYETAENRSNRIAKLASEVAVADVQWITEFVNWLRNEANMRSISLIIALQGARGLVSAGVPGARQLVSSAIVRADEPGEALAWWYANVGRKIPAGVKRGIADSAARTYNQYTLAKYDTDSHGFRFADVINLTHPTPVDSVQSDLFKYALDRRRDSNAEIPASLTRLQKRKAILSSSLEEKRALLKSTNASAELKAAGLTWENVGSSFGKDGLDAQAWEALIPTLGYMALIRNLRDFEKKGVSDKVLNQVASRLVHVEEIAKSRQLPFRFLSAYRAVSGQKAGQAPGSGRFDYPLEKALQTSLMNIPSLDSDTLILVDRSGSMYWEVSKHTDMNFADTGALFGAALAVRAEKATLVEFGNSSQEVAFTKNSSVLKLVNTFHDMGGTKTKLAVDKHFTNKYKRVIIITDEQSDRSDPAVNVPANVPVYTFNLAGYKYGHPGHQANRFLIGGLQDQSFGLIPMLEAGYDAKWPWEK
jgi:hypothetical protein